MDDPDDPTAAALEWRPPGARSGPGPVEAVDWGRGGPSELLTLNALRVLPAGGVTRAGGRARPGSAPR
jgi:hypothetical protein